MSFCENHKLEALLYLFCAISFVVQESFLVYHSLYPQNTVTNTGQKHLSHMDFPLVFKICLRPGYNRTVLRDVGYVDEWAYFAGCSRWAASGYIFEVGLLAKIKIYVFAVQPVCLVRQNVRNFGS